MRLGEMGDFIRWQVSRRRRRESRCVSRRGEDRRGGIRFRKRRRRRDETVGRKPEVVFNLACTADIRLVRGGVRGVVPCRTAVERFRLLVFSEVRSAVTQQRRRIRRFVRRCREDLLVLVRLFDPLRWKLKWELGRWRWRKWRGAEMWRNFGRRGPRHERVPARQLIALQRVFDVYVRIFPSRGRRTLGRRLRFPWRWRRSRRRRPLVAAARRGCHRCLLL